ncbi:MAG: 30S ribosomal protein S21 [Candidatus Latescibacteria bacterium]|nr:30S ribosomal protein S21 [Candidatus Latescibacterota bacterium]
MPGIVVQEREPFEMALKRFSKVCKREGLMSELKKRQYLEKPSERRKKNKRKKNGVI